MVDDIGQDTERAKKDFLVEAEELLDEISLRLAEMEENLKVGKAKPDVVNAVFRGIHSLKGLSGMLGFTKITQLTHDLENLLDELRMGKIPISNEIIDFLYDCIDAIVGLTEEISLDSETSLVDVSKILSQVERFLASSNEDEINIILEQLELDPNILKVLTEYEEYRLTDNIKRRVNIFSMLANFNFDTFDDELSALNSKLRDVGEIITTLPSIEPIGETEIQFNLLVGTELSKDDLHEQFSDYSLTIRLIPYKTESSEPQKVKIPPKTVIETAPPLTQKTDASSLDLKEDLPLFEDDSDKVPEKKSQISGKSVRVNLDKIDNVMNMIGELSISRSVIDRIAQELRETLGFYRANDLLKTTRNLEKQILRLQSHVIEVRMVPLEQLFNRLARNVKKIAREINKKIDFHISGEETELDKMIIEDLSDPLLHLLRNAIDHGIEKPQERISKGKNEIGNIWLDAYQKGNNVVISVSDDGRGIDANKLKERAKSMNINDKFPILREEDIYQLIFLPGFSTRETASEFSGRGVGMDIVKKNLAKINGAIRIETKVDSGTRFIIGIPLTMAIISALIIISGGEKFVIPIASILKSIKVFPEDIHSIDNREVITYQDSPIPILRLSTIFGLQKNEDGEKQKYEYAVIVHSAEKILALFVDKIIGRQDIVIKTLGKRMVDFPGIAGGTEIGDEKAVLVIDVASLIMTYEESLTFTIS